MITRRIVQALLATTLALAAVFGITGIASAAFTSKAPATANLSVSALTLQPPTGLTATCIGPHWYPYPTVTFTPSASRDIVAGRTSKLGYKWEFTNDALLSKSGNGSLAASDTRWDGPYHAAWNTNWTFTMVTTYGNWTSAPAELKFTC